MLTQSTAIYAEFIRITSVLKKVSHYCTENWSKSPILVILSPNTETITLSELSSVGQMR
jgi:hypothetical protein